MALALGVPAIAAAKRTLYASDVVARDVAAFDITTAASLDPLPGSPFRTAGHPEGVALTRGGKYLYTPDVYSGAMTAYRVNHSGSLHRLPTSQRGCCDPSFAVAASPDGRWIYTTNGSNDETSVNQFRVGRDGTLTLRASPGAGSAPAGLALTPDGRHLFVSDPSTGRILAYRITPTGRMSDVSGSPFTVAGTNPEFLALTPDGAHLYATDRAHDTIEVFDIETDGGLTPVPGSPFTTIDQPVGLTVTANGAHLFTNNRVDQTHGSVSAFDIGSDGTPTAVAGSPFGTTDLYGGIVSTPNSNRLYIQHANTVSGYKIASGAAITPLGSPVPTGGQSGGWLAIAPDQPPIAKFSISTSGRKLTVNANASRDPDGRIVRYDWSFGDGSTSSTTRPVTSHRYTGDGTYAVTVTETDREGCSTTFAFTGQTASCNGGPGASAQQSVTVAAGHDSAARISRFGLKRRSA